MKDHFESQRTLLHCTLSIRVKVSVISFLLNLLCSKTNTQEESRKICCQVCLSDKSAFWILTYIVGLVSLSSLTLFPYCVSCAQKPVVQVKVRSVIVFLIFFFVSCGLFTFHTWRNSCWNSVVQVHNRFTVDVVFYFVISCGHCIGLLYKGERSAGFNALQSIEGDNFWTGPLTWTLGVWNIKIIV